MNNYIGQNITLDNGEEYFCFNAIEMNGNNYLFLTSTTEPVKVIFASCEDAENNRLNLRIVNNREEKLQIFKAFKDKLQKLSQSE